jgi:putative membrane protein
MTVPKPSWKVFLAGVLGGAIDAAPSISGATVYYVVGIYTNLLQSITRAWDSLAEAVRTRSFRPIQNEMGWRYLLVLKSGVILSFLIFAHSILHCLQIPAARQLLFSLFLGFILGSTFLCLNRVVAWTKTQVGVFVVGLALGLFVVYGLPLFAEPLYSVPVTAHLPAAENVDLAHSRLLHVPFSAIASLKEQGILDSSLPIFDEGTGFTLEVTDTVFSSALLLRPALVLTGVVVATAMLLPGISGSYVLNVLGYYSIVLSAVLEVVSSFFYLKFPMGAWALLLNLGLGVLCGLIVLSRIVLRFFKKHPCATQAFIAGCMIGSLSSLWPFQKLAQVVDPFHSTQGVSLITKGWYLPSLPETLHSWHLFVGIALAFCTVFVLQKISLEKPSYTQTN